MEQHLQNSKYDNIKSVYIEFIGIKNEATSNDSFIKYKLELNMLKYLKQYAIEESKNDELNFINHRFELLKKKFELFGIELKDI